MKKGFIISFATSLICLAFDRFTKILALQKLRDQAGVFIFDRSGFDLKLIFSLNENLAFSLPLPQIIAILLILLVLSILIVLCYNCIRAKQVVYVLFYAMIISSAFSNLYDRIYYGGVIDFVSFRIWRFQWAIFNLADVFILAGIIALLILNLKNEKRK